MGKWQGNAHLSGLLEKIARIRSPVAGVNDFGSGSFDLRQVRSEVRQEQLMVIFADDRGFRIIQLQAVFKPVGKLVAEQVVLADNVKFLFFFPDLAVIVGKAAADLIGRKVVRNEYRVKFVAS